MHRSFPLLALVFLFGCSDPIKPKSDSTDVPRSNHPPADCPECQGPCACDAPQEAVPGLATLSGVVLLKPGDVKDVEVWQAAQSPYYVLDVGQAEVKERTASEGVILKFKSEAEKAAFEALLGKTIEVKGIYIPHQPYTPQSPMEQYPTGMDGKPLPRGGGFEVASFSEKP